MDDFFQRILPSLIAERVDRWSRTRGTCAFAVDGQTWTVRLGVMDAPIARGFARDADLRLWFSGPAFTQFLAGERPGGNGCGFHGDLAVLERLGRFLQHDALASGGMTIVDAD